MRVNFKNDSKSYNCSEPLEQKIFKAGMPAGWLMRFNIIGEISAEDVDALIKNDGISKLTFTNYDEKSFVVADYETVTACTIRHTDNNASVELQLTKLDSVTNEVDAEKPTVV